jgi:N-acylneuraminate cytidylyltransferase
MRKKTPQPKKPSVVAIIPARGGSKGVPRKNIKMLAGKPLIAHMLAAALQSKYITTLAVSSEDDEILRTAQKWGRDKTVLIKRPKKFAKDKSPSLPVIEHAVKKLERARGEPFDYVVMLQCTAPLTATEDIDGCLHKLVTTGADSVMSVVQINHTHPVKIKRVTGDDRLIQYVSNMPERQFTRQQLDRAYQRNGAIYASKRDIVIERGELYGGDHIVTRPYIVPEERSVDINNVLDFLVVEALLKQHKRGKK